jgi:uncharacterized protein (TIGR02246 family)
VAIYLLEDSLASTTRSSLHIGSRASLRVLVATIGFFWIVAHAAIAVPVTLARGSSASIGAERRAIDELTSRFIKAFENLDLPAFISCFADDATVFFPVPEPPARFAGKVAIQTHFRQVFDALRKSARSGPPYHRLIPQDVHVQLLGPAAAVMSFQLQNAERIGRRTLVLRKLHGTWLIAHLHASNVPITPGAEPRAPAPGS